MHYFKNKLDYDLRLSWAKKYKPNKNCNDRDEEGIDKQYEEIGNKEWQRWVQKYYQIHNKYGGLVQISYLFDFDKYLDYKDSPIDKGKEIFLTLYNNRIRIG